MWQKKLCFFILFLFCLVYGFGQTKEKPKEELGIDDFLEDEILETEPSPSTEKPAAPGSQDQKPSVPSSQGQAVPSSQGQAAPSSQGQAAPSSQKPAASTAAPTVPQTSPGSESSTSEQKTPVRQTSPASTSSETSKPSSEQPARKKVVPEDVEIPSQTSRSGANTFRFSENQRNTQYITFSGFVGAGYIYRDELFSTDALGDKSTHLDGDFFDLRTALRMNVKLSNGIEAMFELQNESREGILHHTSLGNLYITNRQSPSEWEWHFERAYLQVGNFLVDGLSFQAGVIPYKYALRSDGGAFFLNLSEAESPFATRADTHAIGIVATYQPKEEVEFYIDGFYLVTSETGFSRKDETVFGLNFDLDMTKKIYNEDGSTDTLPRVFNLLLAGIQGDNKMPIWTIGIGANYSWSDDPKVYIVESYGELLFQFGEYEATSKEPFGHTQDQDHLALGGYVGTKFTYQKSEWMPFFDISFWYISGDDGDSKRKENHDLVTYEDIDSTIILEDNDYGMDIDSNYWAIKFKTGVSLKPITKEEMRFEVLYTHARALDVGKGKSKAMGDELDFRLTWEYTSDLTFSIVAGFLFNSSYCKDLYDELGSDGKKSTFVIKIESMLRF